MMMMEIVLNSTLRSVVPLAILSKHRSGWVRRRETKWCRWFWRGSGKLPTRPAAQYQVINRCQEPMTIICSSKSGNMIQQFFSCNFWITHLMVMTFPLLSMFEDKWYGKFWVVAWLGKMRANAAYKWPEVVQGLRHRKEPLLACSCTFALAPSNVSWRDSYLPFLS